MSKPMNNGNQGGYVPPGFGAGYASANAYPPPGEGQYNPNAEPTAPPANYGFVPNQPPIGYAPVPQTPAYGEAPPYGAGHPPYGAGHPPYMGGSQFVGMQVYDGDYPPIRTQPLRPTQPQPMTSRSEWMTTPASIRNCPRGLEYLTTIDQLLVKQQVEFMEVLTGFEHNNKFIIKNALGQKVFIAVEDTGVLIRSIFGRHRPFHMKIFDKHNHEVMHLHRPLACSSCLFGCCLQKITVSAPPGNFIGTIEQECTFCGAEFRIKDDYGDTVLRIKRAYFASSLGNVDFKVISLTGESVGKISKQWSGFAREIFTDADFFGISFPLDLDVHEKALLLGATFLIDAMFFER